MKGCKINAYEAPFYWRRGAFDKWESIFWPTEIKGD